jgi:hypothetical protein
MLFPFENMPNYSRIWVYQTDKNLSDKEADLIQVALNEQISHWAAHGAPLAGAAKIFYNRFIIIAADENQNATSGCSIDASTNWLKSIGAEMSINFFDRSIAYLSENQILSIDFLGVKKLIIDGKISTETIIFNNLVANIGEFKQNWKQKAANSWLKKYFTHQLV